MPAIKTNPTPIFKPRDIVETPRGRQAKVRDLLPEHLRLVDFMDSIGGWAIFKTSELTLVHEALPRPWKERTL